MNKLSKIADAGQSIWLDYIDRHLIRSGKLQQMVDADGICGVTSNPAIFEKAIRTDKEYASELKHHGGASQAAAFEHLAIADIRAAADVLYPVYERTEQRDGYVSLEVSPKLAHDSEATVAEALRLWREVGRENLMIKVPATDAGIPAIQRLIAEGVNVNATLLFSQTMYQRTAEAFISGLEQRLKNGICPAGVASVASFFVSRIDTAVDALLDKRLEKAVDERERDELLGVRGKVAIANAKLAYQHYKAVFASPRWEALAQCGAQSQRLLWASTGTKNPAYSDILYIEELIGPDTVNTAPPATLAAFREHGQIRASLEEDIIGAAIIINGLNTLGISLDGITDKLLDDGVRLFDEAYDTLLDAIAVSIKEEKGE
ncbi:MAG TPA: transaldolase [Mariprofundaceae bacterium]|nr:transaldolase [Mariprofundaceae bacterium]